MVHALFDENSLFGRMAAVHRPTELAAGLVARLQPDRSALRIAADSLEEYLKRRYVLDLAGREYGYGQYAVEMMADNRLSVDIQIRGLKDPHSLVTIPADTVAWVFLLDEPALDRFAAHVPWRKDVVRESFGAMLKDRPLRTDLELAHELAIVPRIPAQVLYRKGSMSILRGHVETRGAGWTGECSDLFVLAVLNLQRGKRPKA